MKKVKRTSKFFLTKLLSLLVAEAFFCSSILPAWALSQDSLRPRSVAQNPSGRRELERASDGGRTRRRPVIVADFNMEPMDNPRLEKIMRGTLTKLYQEKSGVRATEVVFAVSYPFLDFAVGLARQLNREFADGPQVLIAAQNMHHMEKGPYTGEVSVLHLKTVGVTHVLLGDADRRYGVYPEPAEKESDALLAEKVALALKHDLVPIFFVGDRQGQRSRSGGLEEALQKQLMHGFLRGVDRAQQAGDVTQQKLDRAIIGYQPVWSAGKHALQMAEPDQIQEAHTFIRGLLLEELQRKGLSGVHIRILYSGGLDEKNASRILGQPDVDGGAVHRAALHPSQFSQLLLAAERAFRTARGGGSNRVAALKKLQGRYGDNSVAIGRALYEQFIAKPKVLYLKSMGEDWESFARSNDVFLAWLKKNQNAIYEEIEAAYLEHVRRFAQEKIAPRAFEIDVLDVIPLDLYVEMAKEGLVGTQFRQIDGGVGLSTKAWLEVNAIVSEYSSGVTLGALNVLGSLGPDPLEKPVENPRAEAQRREVLVKLLHGEAIVNFSLTEPSAGSDNAGMRSEVKDEKLNGEKIFITVGTVLPYDYRDILALPEVVSSIDQIPSALRSHWPQIGNDLTLWNTLRRQVEANVKLYEPMEQWQIVAVRTQPKNPTKPHEGISALLVKTKEAGTLPRPEGESLVFSEHVRGKKEKVLGQRGSGTTAFSFDNLPVDLERDNVGTLKDFLRTLSRGRFTISAHALGIIRGLRRTVGAVLQRQMEIGWDKSDGEPVEERAALQHAAAILLEELEHLDILYTQLLVRGADLKDAGQEITVPAALAKILLPSTATEMTQRAIGIIEGLGYHPGDLLESQTGPFAHPYDYAAMRYRDAKLLEIGEGTTQIQEVKIVTPALLWEPRSPEYAAELAMLDTDAPRELLAGLIAQIIRLRNDALPMYRLHQNDEVAGGVKLSDVVFEELSLLEGRIQTLLAGYRKLQERISSRQTGLQERALIWYLADTLSWMRLRAFRNLPREDYMRLQEEAEKFSASDGGRLNWLRSRRQMKKLGTQIANLHRNQRWVFYDWLRDLHGIRGADPAELEQQVSNYFDGVITIAAKEHSQFWERAKEYEDALTINLDIDLIISITNEIILEEMDKQEAPDVSNPFLMLTHLEQYLRQPETVNAVIARARRITTDELNSGRRSFRTAPEGLITLGQSIVRGYADRIEAFLEEKSLKLDEVVEWLRRAGVVERTLLIERRKIFLSMAQAHGVAETAQAWQAFETGWLQTHLPKQQRAAQDGGFQTLRLPSETLGHQPIAVRVHDLRLLLQSP